VKLSADQLVVVDGPFTTAGAAMAQMDLMLGIVAVCAGRRLADNCARYLLLDDRRSQSRYMALSHLAAQDPQVSQAEAWVRRRLGENFTVDDLAAAVGLSPRTFGRRVARVTGLSPIRFIQRLRIDTAVHLLETTRNSVENIAHRVGYAEASTLRRIMRRELKRSPAEIRN
jgi:transcriptional regulator GlxA family with amidase domain